MRMVPTLCAPAPLTFVPPCRTPRRQNSKTRAKSWVPSLVSKNRFMTFASPVLTYCSIISWVLEQICLHCVGGSSSRGAQQKGAGTMEHVSREWRMWGAHGAHLGGDAHLHRRRPQRGCPGGHHAASGMGGPPPRCGPGPPPPLHPPSPPPMAPGHPPPCLGHQRPLPTPPPPHQEGEGQG